jgi:hypothetical protein
MAARTTRDPFEIRLSPERQDALALELSRAIEDAQDARGEIVGDDGMIDQWHTMYEQGAQVTIKSTPWPNAADLGSFIVTDKVDSMRARIVATIMTDPIWIVEGIGKSAIRAPIVEAFHQWKAESSKLQQALSKVVHNSLIEGTGVLEVSDRIVMRSQQRTIHAAVVTDEATGLIVLDEDGHEQPKRDETGKFVEAEPGAPSIEMVVKEAVRATAGPTYRVVGLKDFVVLPGHAAHAEDIWGYAKRVYRRLSELRAQEKRGFYKNVERLGIGGEREQTPAEARQGQDIAPQLDETAEKELWEVLYLDDLDGDGVDEWVICTLSVRHRVLLRCQYQDYGTPHFILYTPHPRPTSVWGYSFAGEKLGSVYDEHAALRNMFADRTVLATSAPFLQVENGVWDPSKRPFGPRTVIPVRDLNDVKQLEVRDVPNSVREGIAMCLSAAERLSGMNDTTTGQMAQLDRTLGEVKIATQQSWIRIDECVKNFQEGMEDLFVLCQLIWINKLEQEPEPMPDALLQVMTERGLPFTETQITADMLRGDFRGKPQKSVEGSDFSAMRADLAQMMTALVQLAQAVPAVKVHLNNPPVVRSIMSHIARIYRWPDRENLVNTFTGAAPPPPPMPPGGPGAGGGPQVPTMGGAPRVSGGGIP